MGYTGSNNNLGVITEITGLDTLTTTSAGVAGMDDLYSQSPQDGQFGILDSDGTPILFRYSSVANVFVRVSPLPNTNQNYFVNDTNSNGVRGAAATAPEWSLSNYSFASGTHTLVGDAVENGFIFPDDVVPNLTEVAFICVHKVLVETGATSTPIFDVRDDNGVTTDNIRLRVVDFGAGDLNWAFGGASNVDTGIDYAQNTEFSFEIYYNLTAGTATIYHNYSATPTSVNNSAVSLLTTGSSAPSLALIGDSGTVNFEAFAAGQLVTQV